MKKIVTSLLVLITAVLFLSAQTNAIVDLSDDIYSVLDYGQMKGYIDFLPGQKPYTQKVIFDALNQMLDFEEELSDIEIATINNFKEHCKFGYYDDKLKNNPVHTRFETAEDAKNRFSFKHDFGFKTDVSGGLYNIPDYNQIAFDSLVNLTFEGDLTNYISYYWYGLIDVTRVPIIYMGDYYTGSDWYTGETKVRTIKTYKNTSYLPYGYNRPWDAKIYYMSNLSAEGLEGWPTETSFGLNVFGDVRTSLFDNHLTIGFGRINREIAGMDEGSSLVLNKNARAFTALDIQATFFSYLKYTYLIGSLEYPSQAYINENWWPQDLARTDETYFFQNNYTLNMLEADFKYVHFDMGTSVVWPNRFALGYIFPLANFVEYQNHIGDGDNLQMFGNLKFRRADLGEVWFSAFIDEIGSFTMNPFMYTRDMFAYQAGFKYLIPNLPFGKISLRYTKIEPYCYTHHSINYTPWFNHYISQNYTNDGYGIGYYLDPNSDELRVDFEVKPADTLTLSSTYQLIRHGSDYGSQAVPGSSYYSEMSPYDRSELRKYFLHDGAYNWINILSVGCKFTPKNFRYKFELYGNLGLVYSYYTVIASEAYTSDGKAENCNYETPYSVANNDEYPNLFGTVLNLGVGIKF